jgi:hypothetical protein
VRTTTTTTSDERTYLEPGWPGAWLEAELAGLAAGDAVGSVAGIGRRLEGGPP